MYEAWVFKNADIQAVPKNHKILTFSTYPLIHVALDPKVIDDE